LYLAGSYWFSKAPTIWQRPFHSVGAAGIFVISFILTYQWPWNITCYRYELSNISDYILTILLLMAAISLLAMCSMRLGQISKLLFGLAPLLATIGYMCAVGSVIFPAILFNVYLFVLGIATITVGVQNGRLSMVNAGMLMLSALIVARFFDSDIGFVLRGIAFIIIGIGFLATNLVMIRRRGDSQ
ncbi:MAG: hypothetical protein AAB110_04335, partial [Candidatus Desantisbacteria bacterium]